MKRRMAKGMAAIQKGKGENSRGIPSVTFIPNVAEFLREHDLAIEILFENLSILQNKYRFMMKHFTLYKTNLLKSMPQLQRTHKAIKHLIAKRAAEEDVTTSFALADSVYVDAKVEATQDTVFLWLGANVMLE